MASSSALISSLVQAVSAEVGVGYTQHRQVRHRPDRRASLVSQLVQRNVPGHLEEKRLYGFDRARDLAMPDAKVRFLDDVIQIADGGKGTAQIRFEVRVVRMHLLDEPSGMIIAGRDRGSLLGGGTHDKNENADQSRWKISPKRADFGIGQKIP